MTRMLKVFGTRLHSALSRSALVARLYLRLLPFITKPLPRRVQQQINNSIHTATWPRVELRPQAIRLGRDTTIMLRPHIGEFDFEALLSRTLHYESELFEFIEQRIINYDIVIDIGANVGVFSTFAASAARLRSHSLRVYAFEPSRKAYARLLDNLALNGLSVVKTFNCAVSDQSGFVDFFEPEGHITNGSFDRNFAALFSPQIHRTSVLAITGEVLEQLVSPDQRLLIKIDVEGAEPKVLRSIARLVRRCAPDLLVEVLSPVVVDLNRIEWLLDGSYQLFHLTAEGPVKRTLFTPTDSRDYFLTPMFSRPIQVHKQIAIFE
jgi:FkbM family methyltransferase